jgi:hypothetical protein
VKARKTITLTAYDALHVYDWLRWYWRDPIAGLKPARFGGCYDCARIGRRLERLIGPAAVRRIARLVKNNAPARHRKPRSVFYDLFPRAEAERLSRATGRSLARERKRRQTRKR